MSYSLLLLLSGRSARPVSPDPLDQALSGNYQIETKLLRDLEHSIVLVLVWVL